MKTSLMKKGSQALALTLLSVCLSLGTSGFASAHSVSDASLAKKWKPASQVYVNPGTVKLTSFGTSGFVLYGHHLASLAPYTVNSADFIAGFCPISPALPIGEVTDLEGNFAQSFSVGTAATTTVIANSTTAVVGGVPVTITANPNGTFSATVAGTTVPLTVGVPAAVGGATATLNGTGPGSTTTITAGGATTTISNPAPITVVVPGTPCVPGYYHLSVQQPVTHELHNATVRIKA